MSTTDVTFWYHLGVPAKYVTARGDYRLVGAALAGAWDTSGRPGDDWSRKSMQWVEDDSGCVAFRATVPIDDAFRDHWFRWGVALYFANEGGGEAEIWGIPTEVQDPNSRDRHRLYRFNSFGADTNYRLTLHRFLGANRCQRNSGLMNGTRFVVWAPHAQSVEVVFGRIYDRNDPAQSTRDDSLPIADIYGGYIDDDGKGARPGSDPIAMAHLGGDIWASNPNDSKLPHGGKFLDHVPYMYRIQRDDGSVRMRTDIYSRCQIGYGATDPASGGWSGAIADLDGTKSCSVVVDPHAVTKYFREEPPYHPAYSRVWPEREFISDEEFWRDEFPGGDRIVRNVADLIIYELHPGALGYGSGKPGTLEDVIKLLNHIAAAGFNAVEVLPMSEFGGGAENWGYATSHYFAVEYGGGGRDQFKFFVKESHRRGLAVIMDVVYNHFTHDAERAQHAYSSPQPENDFYYWYEGRSSDYPHADGGYVDNESTAYAPRYYEENIRKMFLSSAVALLTEFHVDGFRVDQTTSIHGYNKLHADGKTVVDANIFGGKMLREFGRTLRLIKPDVVLMAEDHSTWDEVTRPVAEGGMGFDARWYSDFYHHLAGDTNRGSGCASLIYAAAVTMGQGGLKMSHFSGALDASRYQKIVYCESHDEAGNSKGPFYDPDYNRNDPEKMHTSHRTLVVASNGAPLVDATREYAEARSRFAWGMTALSAGTPMVLFGEEVGAVKRFKYNAVLTNKEDYLGLAAGAGARLLLFFHDVNMLRTRSAALRSRNIEIIAVHDDNRVIVFRRWLGSEEYLIFANLSDTPYDQGYGVNSASISNRVWRDCLNSDSTYYGGQNLGNSGPIYSSGGWINSRIPRSGLIVLQAE